jgi:hypothetical protein
MKRTRKPGAGRKPKPPERKTVMLTLRVQPELKAALVRAGRGKKRWSLSNEVTDRLEESLSNRGDYFGSDRERQLGMIVARCAQWIHLHTGVSWRDSPWAFQALAACLQQVLPLLGPAGPVEVPQKVADEVARWTAAGVDDSECQRYGSPEGIGARVAGIIQAMFNAGDLNMSVEWANDLGRAAKVLGLSAQQKEPQS